MILVLAFGLCTAAGLPVTALAQETAQGDVAPEVAESEAPMPCADDPNLPVKAVREVFAKLAVVYEESVPPGPAGLRYRESRGHQLIDRFADTKAFSDAVLAGLVLEPTVEMAQQVQHWESVLGALLRQRLKKRLRDPRGHVLEIREASLDCREARVKLSFHRQDRDKAGAQVLLNLMLRSDGWKIYDMAVEGIGLVRTWRNRLERIRRDKGMAGVQRQMATMQRKLGVRPMVQVPIPQ